MPSDKRPGQRVAQLRKVIGKSQSQFAAMVGVSKHTIISVENGRNQLSRKLAERIHAATGASLMPDGPPNFGWNKEYTVDQFNRWRHDYYPSNEATARKHFDVMKMWLRVIFLAAAKPGVAGNRDRLPAVRESFAEWLEEVRDKFKLENEIEEILPEETRDIGLSAYDISQLLKKPKEAKKTLAEEHDIDFRAIRNQLAKQAANSWLIVEDEYRAVWSPHHPFAVPVNTRKLIKAPKCWIRTLAPDWNLSNQLDLLTKPYEPHEKLFAVNLLKPV